MTSPLRPMMGLMAALTLWAGGGCGEGKPAVDTSHTEATVKGVVKINGEPATEGEISFDPANYLRKNEVARLAPIGKDGTYTIKTLTGENQIKLKGMLARKTPALQYEARMLDVKSGENTFDFEVTVEKGKGKGGR